MSLNKPLTAITEDDLRQLIDDRVAESQTVDYKRGLFLDAEHPKNEFRADTSSFANASGGHLVIGMDEKEGFPTDLCGMEIPNPDAFKMRIDEVLQFKISPRIPGCAACVIALQNGKSAAVIRIPQSFNKPHQVTVNKDDFQFWSRNSAGKYRLAVDELRSIITQSDTLTTKIREFRSERIGNLMAGETPATLKEGARTVLHMIPLNAFGGTHKYNVAELQRSSGDLVGVPGATIQAYYNHFRHNLDGVVTMLGYDESGMKGYLQVFRNGILEAVEAESINHMQSKPCWHGQDEKLLIESVARGLKLQQHLGVEPPVIVLVTLMNVKGFYIYRGRLRYGESPVRFSKETLALPDVLVDNLEARALDVVRPILDSIWNTGGYACCLNIENGKHTFPE